MRLQNNCLNAITNFNIQLICRVTIDHRYNQIAGAAEQRNDFAFRTFAKSIDHALDLDAVQLDHDFIFILDGIAQILDADVRGEIAEMINVNNLAAPAIARFVEAEEVEVAPDR